MQTHEEAANSRTQRVERLNIERIDLMFLAMEQRRFSMKIPRAFDPFHSEGRSTELFKENILKSRRTGESARAGTSG
jgi:hypothetical protein